MAVRKVVVVQKGTTAATKAGKKMQQMQRKIVREQERVK